MDVEDVLLLNAFLLPNVNSLTNQKLSAYVKTFTRGHIVNVWPFWMVNQNPNH